MKKGTLELKPGFIVVDDCLDPITHTAIQEQNYDKLIMGVDLGGQKDFIGSITIFDGKIISSKAIKR